MVNGPNGASRNGKKLSHLTMVSKKHAVMIQKHLPPNKINGNTIPVAFKVFERIDFETCDRLRHPAMRPFLNLAIEEYLEQLRETPNYLKAVADDIRICGLNKVIFRFEAREIDRAIFLVVLGMDGKEAAVETDIILLPLDA
jgi:hypothetical protein